MAGRSVLIALTGAIAVIILGGGVHARDLLQIGVGLGGLGLAGAMYIWGQPPPAKGE